MVEPSILLVHADQVHQRILCDFLSALLPDSVVMLLDSSEIALEWALVEPFNLIITANLLDPFPGVELIRRIRAHNATVPLILYSSLAEPEYEARAAGATQVIPNGRLPQLMRAVRQLLADPSPSPLSPDAPRCSAASEVAA